MIQHMRMTDNHKEKTEVYFDTCVYRGIFSYCSDWQSGEEFAKELLSRAEKKGQLIRPSSTALWELAAHFADTPMAKSCAFASACVSPDSSFIFEQVRLIEHDVNCRDENIIKTYDSWSDGLKGLIEQIKNKEMLSKQHLDDVAQEAKGFKRHGNEAIKRLLKESESCKEFQASVENFFTRDVLYHCYKEEYFPSLKEARKRHPITYNFLDAWLKGIYENSKIHPDRIDFIIDKDKHSNYFVDAVLLSRISTEPDGNPVFFVTEDGEILEQNNYLDQSSDKIIHIREYLKSLGFETRK